METSATFTIGGTDYHIPPMSLIGLATGGVIVLATTVGYLRRGSGELPTKRGIPFIGAWDFFTKRYNFLDDGIKLLGSAFTFNILHHKVIAISGPEARQAFFGSRHLQFDEAYDILFGGSPELAEISQDAVANESAVWFSKRISSVLRRNKVAISLPLMIADLDRIMRGWGTAGVLDPFQGISDLVFQITIRATSCRELADNPEAVKRVAKLYWDIEHGSTPAAVLLPWLPSKARSSRADSIKELYEMFKAIINDRKAKKTSEDDAMQILLDEGDSLNDIVQFILRTLFAGIINTATMSSWMTLYFHANPYWKSKVKEEVRAFLDKYDSGGGGTLAEKLARIPPQVWDEELHNIDLCLSETIRVIVSNAFLRRNISDDLVINGHKIPHGTFLAVPISSVHHNEDIYPEPMKWDPSRFEKGEDKKEPHSFVGWGAGRHPCIGMRFAKMEIKAIMTMFLMQYDCELVDGLGKLVTELPVPDRNNLYQTPPVTPVCECSSPLCAWTRTLTPLIVIKYRKVDV